MAENGSGERLCGCSLASVWPHRTSACRLRQASQGASRSLDTLAAETTRAVETVSQQVEALAEEALKGLDVAADHANQSLELLSVSVSQHVTYAHERVREHVTSALYLRPSWNTSYASAVGVLRAAAKRLPADVKTLRMTTDHEIPRWLPTLPRGVKSLVTSLPAGEWFYPNYLDLAVKGSSPDLASLGEVYEGKVILYAHGGGFCMCNTATHRGLLYRLVKVTGAVIFAVDYRRPPEHPYPAPVDDCVSAYTALLEHFEPSRVFFAGDSAGGCIALTAILAADRAGLPRPAGAVLLSPWVNLQETDNDSWTRNASCDFIRPHLASYCAGLYRGEAPWEEVSPSYFSEESLARLPPLLFEYGECEVFFDQISEFAGKCSSLGVTVDLNVRAGTIP